MVKHVRKAVKPHVKIPQSLPFKKGFLEKDFCSFENSLLGCSKDLFQKKCPGGQCQFLCFESQCPKITDLSKALKAKLSSIPSGVTSLSLPNLDQNGGGKTTTIVVGPHSTTRRGDSSHARGAPLEASFKWWCMYARSFGCSLSVGRNVGLPLALW